VIYDVSHRQKIRPERPLAMSSPASQVGVLASPVSAATAALILLVAKAKGGDVAKQSTVTSGMTGAIALFGLAWLASTFVADHKLLFALALFIVGILTTSQSGTTKAIVPVGLSLGLSPAVVTAMWPSVMGMYSLPANGSQIATVAFDQTGTTRIGKYVVNHSFMVPTLIFAVVAVTVGFVVLPLV
jgi:anaerobic C4-dicarboxylate transporter DcuB